MLMPFRGYSPAVMTDDSQTSFLFSQPPEQPQQPAGDVELLLADLNPPQRQAVEHYQGPLLVLAGAGSGKTRVLTRRIAHLVLAHGVKPENILAVTFTNKATAEMKNRMLELLGEQSSRIWVNTFHAAAVRMLRQHGELLGFKPNWVIYDDDDAEKVILQLLKLNNINHTNYPPKRVFAAFKRAKNRMQKVGPLDDLDEQRMAELMEAYQKALLAANAMDFEDLLVNVVRLLSRYPEILAYYQHKFGFVLVDEFQDTNLVQYQFLRMITREHHNLFVVGDDDQSIYAFRGATIKNILDFERDYKGTKVVKLEQNYRSSATILEVANAVIKANTGRKGKKLWTEAEAGENVLGYVAADEGDEAFFVVGEIMARKQDGYRYNDFAVFYRTNAQSRALEEALMRARIPYKIYGALRFYERKEIKDVLGYLRLLANEADDQAFLRIVNTPARGIGAAGIEKLRQLAQSQGCSLYRAAQKMAAAGQRAVSEFVGLIEALKTRAASVPLSGLVQAVIEDTGLGAELEAQAKLVGKSEVESRLENLRELRGVAAQFEQPDQAPLEVLAGFLERVTLSTSDERPEEKGGQKGMPNNEGAVVLMTLHIAKGLEFPVVFLTGLEEGLLPHQRSIDSGDVEEERRLCYVGITRAMRVLYVTRTTLRGGGGFSRVREVSRFALEIPKEKLSSLRGNFTARTVYTDSSFEMDEEALAQDSIQSARKISRAYQVQNGGHRSIGAQRSPLSGGALKLDSDWLLKADQLPPPAKKKTPEMDLPPAALEDLVVGAKVMHPAFGAGEILEVERGKAQVRFESYPEPKKLVLKHARLALVGT